MDAKQKKIRSIACKVRKELERFINKKCSNFGWPNPGLSGYCYYGAIMLHEALTEQGFDAKIASGLGHWFAICEGYLVDVTASQFGLGKVVTRNYEHVSDCINSGEYHMSFWQVNNRFDSAEEANLVTHKMQIIEARNDLKKKKTPKV